MARPTITPVNEERAFHVHELFFSVTDRKGIIEFGNDVFSRIAGYSLEDMIGEPHNIIRHPDMPRAVFKLLWDYLEAGRAIVAYVKNLAADGRHYWVLALVLPYEDRYVSIRLKPSSDLFEAIKDVYARTLAFQKRREKETGSMKQALADSAVFLQQQVQAAGFASYDELMWSALHLEMQARRGALDGDALSQKISCESLSPHTALGRLAADCEGVTVYLDGLFASLDGFVELSQGLAAQASFLIRLAESIRRSSLNAEIASSHLGERGLALAEIAGQMSAQTTSSIKIIASLRTSIDALQGPLLKLVFDMLIATLDIEMTRLFLVEVCKQEHASEDERRRTTGYIVALMRLFEERSDTLIPSLEDISGRLQKVRGDINGLQRFMRALGFVQFSGQIEAARIPDSLNFAAIFVEVLGQLNEANKQVSDFEKLVSSRLHENASMLRKAEGLPALLDQARASTASVAGEDLAVLA